MRKALFIKGWYHKNWIQEGPLTDPKFDLIEEAKNWKKQTATVDPLTHIGIETEKEKN